MTTPINYIGKVPPRMAVAITYTINPRFSGSGGGPVTPVPTAEKLQGGFVGTPYSETIGAQGGTGTYTAFTIISGAAPTGLSLNSSTGVLSGTPTATGTFTFTAQVKDSVGNTGSQVFQIVIGTPVVNYGFVG